MTAYSLSDEQWCVLDLLMRAKERGVERLNRKELLSNAALPDGAKLKLTWAALTIDKDLVVWRGEHDFAITDAGISLYRLRFGQKVVPTRAADSIICLPDLTRAVN